MPSIGIGGGRTATPSDLSGVLALLEAISNPKRTKEALEALQEAQKGVDAKLASITALQAESDRTLALAASRQAEIVEAQRKVDANAVKVVLGREELDAAIKEHNSNVVKVTTGLNAREASLEERYQVLQDKATALDARETKVQSYEAESKKNLADRDAEMTEKERQLEQVFAEAKAMRDEIAARLEAIQRAATA
jgi:chromosome segregation ATPase